MESTEPAAGRVETTRQLRGFTISNPSRPLVTTITPLSKNG
jgi:hypothetical protein